MKSTGQVQVTRDPKLVVTCDCCGSSQFVPDYCTPQKVVSQPLCSDCGHIFVEEGGDLCPACETKWKLYSRRVLPVGQSQLDGVE